MRTRVGLLLVVAPLVVPAWSLAADFKLKLPPGLQEDAEVTGEDTDKGAFKTPTLRDVTKRGPYMHDGSERTLADVVAFYNRGGVKNPWLSSDMKPLGLTAEEQTDLVEFMKALTGRIDPEVSRPPDLPK